SHRPAGEAFRRPAHSRMDRRAGPLALGSRFLLIPLGAVVEGHGEPLSTRAETQSGRETLVFRGGRVLIFLTHANHLYSDRKQVRKMQPYPPLETLIAANVLRREGHEVEFFDCTFDRDYRAVLDRSKPDLVAVCEDNFNFLTKMCLLE